MTSLEADIEWHREQIEACRAALAAAMEEPPSPSRDAEGQVLVETLGRYQSAMEHLVRLRRPNQVQPRCETLAQSPEAEQ
ncbi:MAG: hypothetical protein EON93_09850 [Burkholderiales bacterium]|nr:MAG: hypothetical protein EON93_09850 [Burkholderiales bacterium]